MYVGHIYLAASMNETGESFANLIEALGRQGVRQHILVRHESLARRVVTFDSVVVGPIVKAPVMAYCLMPAVQVVHIHCDSSASAGLLLTLTRSIPYVFTCRTDFGRSKNPLRQSIFERSAGLIFPDRNIALRHSVANHGVPFDIVADADHGSVSAARANNRIAAMHVRIYRRAVESRRIPELLL